MSTEAGTARPRPATLVRPRSRSRRARHPRQTRRCYWARYYCQTVGSQCQSCWSASSSGAKCCSGGHLVKTALVDLTRSVAVTSTEDQVQPQVPAHLRTGRSTGHRRFPLPPPPPRTGAKRRAAADLVAALQPIKVKGFDKPAFLADKVSELVSDRLVGEVWVHVEEVWGTILGWAE